jgi:hypothetical protein
MRNHANVRVLTLSLALKTSLKNNTSTQTSTDTTNIVLCGLTSRHY